MTFDIKGVIRPNREMASRIKRSTGGMLISKKVFAGYSMSQQHSDEYFLSPGSNKRRNCFFGAEAVEHGKALEPELKPKPITEGK